MAASLWGREWGGLTVLCNCDNEAVVVSIKAGRAKETYNYDSITQMLLFHWGQDLLHNYLITYSRETKWMGWCLVKKPFDLFFLTDSPGRATASSIPQVLVEGLFMLNIWTSPGAGSSAIFKILFGYMDLQCGKELLCYILFGDKWSPITFNREKLVWIHAMKHQSIKWHETSMKCYLSAARHLQIMSGQGNPFREKMPLFSVELKMSKQRGSQPPKGFDLPLCQMCYCVFVGCWSNIPKILITLCSGQHVPPCFLGFIRSGKITVPSLWDFDPGAHLCVGDVTLDSWSAPQIAQLNMQSVASISRASHREAAILKLLHLPQCHRRCI